MRLSLIVLFALSNLFWGCCSNVPPVNEVPQYGYPQKSLEEIKADSIFQKELTTAKKADSTHEAVNNYIAEGFSQLDHHHDYQTAIKNFNKAWLLDSLNPHIYMGFALCEMSNGNTKKAIDFYAKYRELYEKNPIPRPHKAEQDGSSESTAAATARQSALVYGKLVSLTKDNGWDGHWEINWPSIAISDDDIRTHYYLEHSNTLPENERYILNSNLYTNPNKPFYTVGTIQIIQFFDEQSGKWTKPTTDSVYEFSYVERMGLFFSEELKGLVMLGETFEPNSSARVFLLKPYAFLSDTLVLNSYTDPLPEGKLQEITPSTLKFKPYQKQKPVEPINKPPVRSGIIRALHEGKYDSLHYFLNTALKLEKLYGSSPINDEEFLGLNAFDDQTSASSEIQKKAWNETHDRSTNYSINDSLQLLIAFRSYPYVFTDKFYDKIDTLPKPSLLKETAQKPFATSLKKIPDSRTKIRAHLGSQIKAYNGSMSDYLKSPSVGANLDLDFCILYGCASMGLNIFGGKATGRPLYNKDLEMTFLTGNGVSLFWELGVRPFFNEHMDLELHGILDLSSYSIDNTDSSKTGNVNFGIGTSFSYTLHSFSHYTNNNKLTTFDIRLKLDYIWNRAPKRFKEFHGNTLSLTLQLGIGGFTPFRYEEELQNSKIPPLDYIFF